MIERNRPVFRIEGASGCVFRHYIDADSAGILIEKPAGHRGQKRSRDAVATVRRQNVDPLQFSLTAVPVRKMSGNEADDFGASRGNERGA